jgi:hypothetical protein
MDDDRSSPDSHEIIGHLCLEAGRLMEDTSVELARALPADASALAGRLSRTRSAAQDSLWLLLAAQVLQRSRND